mmetsp:Transcript_87471/g.245579  ORF Transcript_87471/g.245579 Transcript_87471/m.245579 type:complete len:256 (+) Transcript_87471:478-1245(+)
MHSFKAWSDVLISALSRVRSVVCWSVSCLRSVPAQSAKIREPPVAGISTMHTQWDLEDSSFRPCPPVVRPSKASPIVLWHSSGHLATSSVAPTMFKSPLSSSRSFMSARSSDKRSTHFFPIISKAFKRTLGLPLVPFNWAKSCCDAKCRIASMVYVLPLPVCPNMKSVANWPPMACVTNGDPHSIHTSSFGALGPKVRLNEKFAWFTNIRTKSEWKRQLCTTTAPLSSKTVTASNSPCFRSLSNSGRQRTKTWQL